MKLDDLKGMEVGAIESLASDTKNRLVQDLAGGLEPLFDGWFNKHRESPRRVGVDMHPAAMFPLWDLRSTSFRSNGAEVVHEIELSVVRAGRFNILKLDGDPDRLFQTLSERVPEVIEDFRATVAVPDYCNDVALSARLPDMIEQRTGRRYMVDVTRWPADPVTGDPVTFVVSYLETTGHADLNGVEPIEVGVDRAFTHRAEAETTAALCAYAATLTPVEER